MYRSIKRYIEVLNRYTLLNKNYTANEITKALKYYNNNGLDDEFRKMLSNLTKEYYCDCNLEIEKIIWDFLFCLNINLFKSKHYLKGDYNMAELQTYQKTIPLSSDSMEILRHFINYIDVKSKSADTYRNGIYQFLIYMKTNNIKIVFSDIGNRFISREDIISWREELKLKHKPTTVQTYLTSVKLFFQWLNQEALCPNIAEHIKGVKIDKDYKKDYLTSYQSQKVLECIEKNSIKGKRDYAIIALMLTSGLRTVEIVRANIEDIKNVGDYTALFVQGKGRDEKNEQVKIDPRVEEAIRSYLSTRYDENNALFISTSNNNNGQRMTTRSISMLVKQALKNAGFDSDRLTAHSLRHTAGTLALINGAKLTDVQQLLRHSNINTTMIYNHAIDIASNDSVQRIANAIFI